MKYLLCALLFAGCYPTTKYVVDKEAAGGKVLQVHDRHGGRQVLRDYPPYNFANQFFRLKVGDTILYLKKSNRVYAVWEPKGPLPVRGKTVGAWMIFNYCDDWIKYEPKCKCK